MRTPFDWWGAIAQGSNPASAGSLARGAAQQANPLTSKTEGVEVKFHKAGSLLDALAGA
jgi:hypothetical protein